MAKNANTLWILPVLGVMFALVLFLSEDHTTTVTEDHTTTVTPEPKTVGDEASTLDLSRLQGAEPRLPAEQHDQASPDGDALHAKVPLQASQDRLPFVATIFCAKTQLFQGEPSWAVVRFKRTRPAREHEKWRVINVALLCRRDGQSDWKSVDLDPGGRLTLALRSPPFELPTPIPVQFLEPGSLEVKASFQLKLQGQTQSLESEPLQISILAPSPRDLEALEEFHVRRRELSKHTSGLSTFRSREYVAWLDRFLERYDRTVCAPYVLIERSTAVVRGDTEATLPWQARFDMLNRVIAEFPYFGHEDLVLYRLGSLYMEVSRNGEAREQFENLLLHHPDSQFAKGASQALNTMRMLER